MRNLLVLFRDSFNLVNNASQKARIGPLRDVDESEWPKLVNACTQEELIVLANFLHADAVALPLATAGKVPDAVIQDVRDMLVDLPFWLADSPYLLSPRTLQPMAEGTRTAFIKYFSDLSQYVMNLRSTASGSSAARARFVARMTQRIKALEAEEAAATGAKA